MIWYDGISQVLFPNTSMIRHVLRSFSSSNVKTGCSSTLLLACAHQEHFVNGHWCNFPGIMSRNKVLLPVHRRNPPKPQLLLQKPISLSTFLFASSSPTWARRSAEEPQLQGARLWKGLTSFQNACCLDVQSMLTDLLVGPSEWARHELELKSRSRCVGIDCSGSDSAKLPMVASGVLVVC